jgi:hypothetical protein
MTVEEYQEDLDRQLELGLITIAQYNLEKAALKFAEQIIKD